MGMNTSYLGGEGLSTSQMLSLVTNKLHTRFVEKDIKEFDAFNVAILDTFTTINMALPGKHYDAPTHNNVKDFYEQWKVANEETRNKMFSEFMTKNVNINKVDESMIMTALVAPPAAMVAKRTGQTVPQLKLMNAIPDVLFVPSVTVLALIAVKILRLRFIGLKTESQETELVPQATEPVPQATVPETEPVPQATEPVIFETEPVPQATEPVILEIEPVPQATAPSHPPHQDNTWCKLCEKYH
ncbi:uncharacterized protein LOC133317986 [Gastrolobium bilobum]|uniref:uncharacterized protein LOC133317986 n=1 Tax=Gastrolobium bilobum TaxID=150636 RepID=UPI002AB114B7|nr:uncharacterized protein LOC133317986 [Gastrolobium bilobum]